MVAFFFGSAGRPRFLMPARDISFSRRFDCTCSGGAIRDGVSRQFCNNHTSPNHCGESHCSVAYIALFSVTCGYFLLSGLLVRQIKGIK
jgi:hypothetical protein